MSENDAKTSQKEETRGKGNEKKKSLVIIVVLFFLLMTQNSSLLISIRYSQFELHFFFCIFYFCIRGILKENYIKSTGVFLTELFKFFFVTTVSVISTKENRLSRLKDVFKSCYFLFPPAILYFFVNVLYYVSLHHLASGVFAILNQLKTLFAAIFSLLILKTKLPIVRWVSLFLLIVGVVIVKLDSLSGEENKENSIFGLLAVVVMSILSGLAGIYFEAVLKKFKNMGSFSLWERNMQLYFPTIFFSFVYTMIFDGKRVLSEGFLTGYSIYSLLTIISNTCGGIIVSLIIFYGSTILKSYAAAAAIIVTSLISSQLFDEQISMYFGIGALMVVTAIIFWGTKLECLLKKKNNEKDDEEILGPTTEEEDYVPNFAETTTEEEEKKIEIEVKV